MNRIPARTRLSKCLAGCLIAIGSVGFAAGAHAAQPGDAACCPPSTLPAHPPYASRYYGRIDPYPIGYYPYASAYGAAGYELGYYPYAQPYASYAVPAPYGAYGPYAPYAQYGVGFYPYRGWPWAFYGYPGWGWGGGWGWGFPYPHVF